MLGKNELGHAVVVKVRQPRLLTVCSVTIVCRFQLGAFESPGFSNQCTRMGSHEPSSVTMMSGRP